MKRNIPVLLLLFVGLLLALNYKPLYTEPQDSRIREYDMEYKQKREQWIEDMHRTEPGINWKVFENETRLSKYKYQQSILMEKLKNGGDYKTLATEVEIGNTGFKGFWTEKGSLNLAGRIHTTHVAPGTSTVYAASAGGNIWKGNLDGENWTCLNNGFKINDVRMITSVREIKKLITRVIVVGYNTPQVYFTNNDGQTWNSATGLDSLVFGGFIIRAVVQNTTNDIYLLCGEQDFLSSFVTVYQSTNNGTSFSKILTINTDPQFCDIWTPKYDNEDVYIIYRDNISKLVNNQLQLVYKINSKFKSVINFDNLSQTILQGTYVQNQAYLSILFRDAIKDTSYLYTYNPTDGIKNEGIVPIRTFDRNSFCVSVDDPDYLYIGNMECYRSRNRGDTWSKISDWYDYYDKPNTRLHADIPGISSIRRSTGEITLISTDGGLFKSDDKLGSVSNISKTGLNVSQYYSTLTSPGNPKKVFAGSQDQGFQICEDDSNAVLGFEQTISGDYGQLVSGNDCFNVWGVYPGFVIMYDKATQSGIKKYTLDFVDFMKNSLWMPPLADDPATTTKVYLLSGIPVNQSEDKGSYLWKLSFANDEIAYEKMTFNFATHNDYDKVSALAAKIAYTIPKKGQFNYYYVLTSYGRFFYSTDRGINWTENPTFRGPGAHYFYGSSIVISQLNAEKIYLAGSGYSNSAVYVSTDHGQSFMPMDSGLPRTFVYKIVGTPDDDYLFAATEAGPYVYIAQENRWYSMNSPDSPDQTFWSVEYLENTKKVRFSTYGRGIWDFKIVLFKRFNDVSDKQTLGPLSIELKAYPNPFVEKTSVDVISSKTSYYNIRVFDILGNLVKELYSGSLNEGKNQFEWDGKSTNGNKLPDGIYMLTASSEGFTNYVKLILNSDMGVVEIDN
ncbi:MAG: T9SS type A sorting domain-containing protein [Ignavibacteriae bacterium]|nr:T9SS type A sorting domain-containing protein [Ignavibacteriota bacterium]